MENVEVHGKIQRCFILMDGTTNRLVIPINTLQGIDYRRLVDIETRQGSMLRNMSETTCDNGINALVLYRGLIQVVPKTKAKISAIDQTKLVESAITAATTPVKRGRKPKPIDQGTSTGAPTPIVL